MGIARTLSRRLAALWLWVALSATGLAATMDVRVGILVTDLYDVSFPDNQASVDFALWLRYKEPAGKSLDLASQLVFVNAKEAEREVVVDRKGTERYQLVRVRAVLRKNWTVVDYPFDEHTIRIHLQPPPTGGTTWRIQPDTEHSAIDPAIKVSGWEIQPLKVAVKPKTYPSSLGDPKAKPKTEVSRFEASFMIARPSGGAGLFARSFVILFVSVAIALTAARIDPDQLEVRSSLGVGSLFTAVGSQFVIASSLPESNLPTLFDRLHMFSYIVIFSTIVLTVRSFALTSAGDDEKARTMDRRAFWVSTAVYLSGVLILVALNFGANTQTLPA